MVFLVGNKMDLGRTIGRDELEKWAKDRGIQYFECSAKTGEGVNEVFMELLKHLMEMNSPVPQDKKCCTLV